MGVAVVHGSAKDQRVVHPVVDAREDVVIVVAVAVLERRRVDIAPRVAGVDEPAPARAVVGTRTAAARAAQTRGVRASDRGIRLAHAGDEAARA